MYKIKCENYYFFVPKKINYMFNYQNFYVLNSLVFFFNEKLSIHTLYREEKQKRSTFTAQFYRVLNGSFFSPINKIDDLNSTVLPLAV